MSKIISQLCQLIKNTIDNYISQNQPFSFNLLIGKTKQGKTALLDNEKIFNRQEFDHGINFIQSNEGIIIELNEKWLLNQSSLLVNIIKKIDESHPSIGITGFICCIDVSNLFIENPDELAIVCQEHTKFIAKLNTALNRKINLNIFFTKMDLVAGFMEFFLNDHHTELNKPLGFAVQQCSEPQKLYIQLEKNFDKLVDQLSQQVIKKIHAVRSAERRTLIREFPLQIACLKKPVLLILKAIDKNSFTLKTICFTSTRQGSNKRVNNLNNKIANNCALVVENKSIAIAKNQRNYFATGSIKLSQEITKTVFLPPTFKEKILLFSFIGLMLISISINTVKDWKTANKLTNTQQALANFNILQQHDQPLSALYHLLQAENFINKISNKVIAQLSLSSLKFNINTKLEQQIDRQFLPFLFRDIEQILSNGEKSPIESYKALKVYLMFNDPTHRDFSIMLDWYKNNWEKTTTESLKEGNIKIFKTIMSKYKNKSFPINQNLVQDTRNYLNAIPSDYLYYQLIKDSIPVAQENINFPAFNLNSASIPSIYLYNNFSKTLNLIKTRSLDLIDESWILRRLDFNQITNILQKTYYQDYVKWWQNFLNNTKLAQINDYKTAQLVTYQFLKQSSLPSFLKLIKENVGPKELINNEINKIFNTNIASNFSAMFLVNEGQIAKLNNSIKDLSDFLKTLNLVSEDKKTIFELTLNRFNNDFASDPISQIYLQLPQIPAPLNHIIGQLIDQIWYLFIKDSKDYLANLWNKNIIPSYQMSIADHYPLVNSNENHADISLDDFQHFFAPSGLLQSFFNQYLRPFINTSQANWQNKNKNGYILPIKKDVLRSLMLANIISNMFFDPKNNQLHIDFSLQKIELDPIISNFQIKIGEFQLIDTHQSDSHAQFSWPAKNAYVMIKTVQGRVFSISEQGDWGLFKLLQKLNVYVDENDSSNVQIMFDINSNRAQYILKTKRNLNPFGSGILNNFKLKENLF